MTNRLVAGLVAGAAGTVALNVATYLDMLVRGRPASELPGQLAGKLAEEMDLRLDFDLSDAWEPDGASEDSGGLEPAPVSARVEHRKEALGALLGYGNGLGIGLAYGALRLLVPRLPLWITSAALGSAAMAASDVPATRMGLTDPQKWQATDWAADVVPHIVYGLVTAATFEAVRG